MEKNLRLINARHNRNLPQYELAKKINVTMQTIIAIENGTYNPSIVLCRDICQALGLTLDELFGEENSNGI